MQIFLTFFLNPPQFFSQNTQQYSAYISLHIREHAKDAAKIIRIAEITETGVRLI